MQNVKQFADQETSARSSPEPKPVKVIAVTAGKGGVGKTNISVNLAIALAMQNYKVMVLDADLGLANIDIMLGLQPKHTLYDVLNGVCNLSDIIISGPENIQIIPASSGMQQLTSLDHLQHGGIINAFSDIGDDIDYLIIDTAAGISDTVVSFTRSAQEVVVVVCDEPASIVDAYSLIKVMSQQHHVTNFHMLANMVSSGKEGRELYNKLNCVTEQFIQVHLDYLGYISDDPYIKKAVKQQKAVIEAYPNSRSAAEFKKIAESITHWSNTDDGVGGTRFFIERLIANGKGTANGA